MSAPRSSERFLDAVCAAKHTASIKPSLFGNRTDMDPQYVIFSSADEWLPLFQDRINLKEDSREKINVLRKQIMMYHTTYPHIWYTFFVFGIISYFPWHLWKSKENGFIATATKGMDKLPTNPESLQNHVKKLRQHIFNRDQRSLVSYLTWYWVANVVALMNLVFMSFFCNWMLDYELLHFGISYVHYMKGSPLPGTNEMNPLLYYWPPTTLCGRYRLLEIFVQK